MSGANYNGRQPNNSAYIKTFVAGSMPDLWAQQQIQYSGGNINVLLPSSRKNVYIPGNLYLGGEIVKITPSTSNYRNLYDVYNLNSLHSNTQETTSINLLETVQQMQQKIEYLQEQIDKLQEK
jgi:signal peptidase I